MAKRFTDTEKWKREWFSDLKPNAKLTWLYLIDQCDHCGIWPRNFRLATEQLGFKVDHEQLSIWFGNKVVFFGNDKYFIPSFFTYQYGSSKSGFKAKESALNTITGLGLDKFLNCHEVSPKCSEDLGECSEQLPNCPSIGTINSNIIIKEGECEGKQNDDPELTTEDLVSFWNDNRGVFSEVEKLTDERKRKAKSQLEKYPNIDHWQQVLSKFKASTFCREKWKPNFDDFLKENKRVSALEGKYDDRKADAPKFQTGPKPISYPNAEQVFAEQEKHREEISLTPDERAEKMNEVRKLLRLTKQVPDAG